MRISRRSLALVLLSGSVTPFIQAAHRANAQTQVPPVEMVVQAPDGSLYVLRGGAKHRLMPVPVTENQLARFLEGPPISGTLVSPASSPAVPANWSMEPTLLEAFGRSWEGSADWAPTDAGWLANDGAVAGVRLLKLRDGLIPELSGDFAVEVEMRGVPDKTGFGLIATRNATQSLRTGYASGALVFGHEETASTGGFMASAKFAEHSGGYPWNPGTDWHTFRLEFRRIESGEERGDQYRFFVDSDPKQATRYADIPGPGGAQRSLRTGNHGLALWAEGGPLQVRALRVLAL